MRGELRKLEGWLAKLADTKPQAGKLSMGLPKLEGWLGKLVDTKPQAGEGS